MSLYLSAHEGDTERLRDALESDRPAIRRRASELLGEHTDASDVASVEALLEHAMNDGDAAVREAAVAALDALGPEALDRLVLEEAFDRDGQELSVKACARVLQSDRAELRLAAIHALERLDDRRGVKFVVQGLRDEDPRVRRRAAGACGTLGDERCVGPLAERLTDHEGIKRAALIALGQIGTEQACKALVSKLSSDAAIVRRDAARALGIARYTPAISSLLARVDDEDPRVSGAAFRATMELLPDLPETHRERARAQLLSRLQAERTTGAEELLLTLTRDGRRAGLRHQAIWLLGHVSDPDDEAVIRAMVGALEADERTVRREARDQLIRMNGKRVRHRLAKALERNIPAESRAAAAWILGHIGGERAVNLLERLEDDEEAEVRKQAHGALERIGGVER